MFMRTAVAVGLALVLAACTLAPINNVQDAAFPPTASGKTPKMSEVRAAIIAAGANLGWTMTETKSGLVQGTLMLRKHVAVVEIPYSERSYSIVYKSSENLDASGGQIHKNYNGWVQNLERAINARVAAIN